MFQEFILSTVQITFVVISDSFFRTDWVDNTSTSGAGFFLWTSTIRVFLTSSLASALTGIFILNSISSTNWSVNIWTFVTTYLVGLFLLTDTERIELSIVTFQFTQVSVSDSILSTSWQENLRTVLTSSLNRWTFTIGLFNNTNTVHSTFVIISSSINTTNRSV